MAPWPTRFREVYQDIEGRRAKGEIGFFDLPSDAETARGVQEVADSFGQWFENVVVLGIGGSGLGAVTLRDALLAPRWNERDEEGRDYFPRLYALDNPDPATVGPLLDRLDLRRTLFNVVSKSGSTTETMALYLVIRERLSALVGEDKVRGHFLFTTDPVQGALRRIADAEGIPTLSVPPNVGGAFFGTFSSRPLAGRRDGSGDRRPAGGRRELWRRAAARTSWRRIRRDSSPHSFTMLRPRAACRFTC